MRMGIVPALVSVVLVMTASLDAGVRTSRFRYPRVYGPTGRPYGPTQAHYQYQRQYGRPWHGQGGLTARHRSFSGHTPGFCGASAPFFAESVVGGFGFGLTPAPFVSAPVVYYVPVYVESDPSRNRAIDEALREEDQRWKQPLEIKPAPGAPAPPLVPSSPEARNRSLRFEMHGDARMKNHEYWRALERYKKSAAAAKDRAAPRFRMAMALTAMGHYAEAVKQLKQAVQISADVPNLGTSLDELFGEDARLAVLSLLHRVTAWVREDIRDPDRLFLLGVLLHFDGDERAAEFFESAWRLAGHGDHLQSFLRSGSGADGESISAVSGDDSAGLPLVNETERGAASATGAGRLLPPIPPPASPATGGSRGDDPPLPDPIPQLPSFP